MSLQQLESVIARFTAMKANWSATVSLEQMRRDLDILSMGFPAPAQSRTEPVSAGGVEAEWLDTPSVDSTKTILYFHGGGFAVGSISGTRHFAAHLSAATAARVLVVGYRLAPEFTFPAPLEDAESAYRWLLSQGQPPGKVALCGDSAGGGLALALIGRLLAAGIALPSCAILFTPWADLRCGAASYDLLRDRDPVGNREMAQMMAATYLGAAGKPDDPRATPVLADFKGYCPLLIQAAGRDVFRDDARAIQERATAAGVDSVLDW
jgi:monoterpene epsilon-lactone hydrolase